MALLKNPNIVRLSMKSQDWATVSLHFFSLPIGFYIVFKTEPAPSFIGPFLLTAIATRSGRTSWIALVFLFKNLLRRGEAIHASSPVLTTTAVLKCPSFS